MARNSSASQPMPTPSMKRPPETMSRLAACLASSSGLLCGRMFTPVPRRRRVVCAARVASAMSGSMKFTSGATPILPEPE